MVENQEFFQLNEKLKEELVLKYEAFEAKTTFYPKGASIIPHPFYESIAKWYKDADERMVAKGMAKIWKYQEKINKLCEMSDPVFETNNGYPQLVWAIFIDD